jgi:hypothetical protein
MDNEAHINNEIVVTNPIIEILKRTFGEKSLIKKNREKWKVIGILDNEELPGGQKFEASVEPRNKIPILLPEPYGEMSGMRIESLLVDSVEHVENYNIFIGTEVEKSGELIPVLDNFSDKKKRIIVLEKFMSGEDLVVLNHEKGHINDKNFHPEEQRKKGMRLLELVKYHLDKNGNLDGIALANDKDFLRVIQYFIKIERNANNWVIKKAPENQSEAVSYFLNKVTYETYITPFGSNFVNTLGKDRIRSFFEKK